MKIVYLHQYYNGPNMSGSTRSYEFCKRLVDGGHEVHVVTTSRDKVDKQAKWTVTTDAGVTIHWYPVHYSNDMGFFSRMRAFVSFSILSLFRLISLKPNLCFATSTPLTIAIPAILGRLLARVPYVFEVRDLWPKVPIAMGVIRNPIVKALAIGLEWLAYRYSAHVVALSPGMAEGVRARCKQATQRVTVIPNSSDIDLFLKTKANPTSTIHLSWLPKALQGREFILYPGTLGKVNDIPYLVELASELGRLQYGIPILVVGDGAEKIKAIDLSKRLGILDEQIFFLPAVSKLQIPDVFRLAAAVISTTLAIEALYANSANKFFDSLASGKPICVNYGGWQAELIRKHRLGVVLSRDTEEAANQLVDFINNPIAIKTAMRNAKMLAEVEFSRDKHFQRLQQIMIASAGN